MPPIPRRCLQDMSESGDVWAALTTLAATTDARQKGGRVEAVAEAKAVTEAMAEAEAVAEAKAETEAEAEAKVEVKTEAEEEAEAEAEAEAKAKASDGTTCNGIQQVSRTEERAAGWTDFRGLVTGRAN